MKLPKELKGKYVSRSAFAKMQMERDRLLKDLEIIVMSREEFIEVGLKWRKHFKDKYDFDRLLKEIAKRELPILKQKYNIPDATETERTSE